MPGKRDPLKVGRRNVFGIPIMGKRKKTDPLDVARTINPVKLYRRAKRRRQQKKKNG